MKPTMALKPLVFALAAVMAMAAQADGRGNGHGNGHGNHGPKGPTLEQLLSISAGAGATVLDVQNSDGNVVTNQATRNTAEAADSLNGSNGNMGANIAAGDGNQQDNAAALATANDDMKFIFGSALSMSSATQVNNNNYVKNNSTQNNASLTNAGNNGSGNIGVNVTAGNFNQQKNNLAIAVSSGRVAQAAAAADQSSTGLVVDNKGVKKDEVVTLTSSYEASGSFKAKGNGTVEDDGGWGNRGGYGGGHDDDKFKFSAVGTFELAGSNTQQVLTRDGWKNPVYNNATMSNSMNGFSGNGGANVSAGVGNQQSNSLSIAAGRNASM
ncbi:MULTISPECIES: heme utilization protein [Pseudomonas]|uniref:heme utilization protein n=1 Tax=Pseudomonas TaxID=286 RepID=UPI0018E64E76|nr:MULTISPECIES: heme utilization protein [Pseudomonas]MBI6619599.1 heme utilization protein [Pseudomonas corrugata]MBI6690751.1 heme utilization protein [Pseudomonas corrugata]WRV70712.1 heme utilization protein [Pseudomonas frederiksbergensis]